MASATRLPMKSVAFTAALVIATGASRVNLRNLLISTFTGPGSYSRIAALAVIVTNLKNAPFAWHFRVFNAILKHCIFSLPSIPAAVAPSTLFLPVITTSHAPLWECDYNFHKSNSTYFTDLDVTRTHLVCCLIQPAIHLLGHNDSSKLVLDKEGKAVKGKWNIMLGGTMCTFKREIGIYQGYEMWSRVLCWDRKWLYIVTHFVKKGTVKPTAYILTDGGWLGKGYKKVEGQGPAGSEVDEKAIFATGISKYVMKLGRLTIHPEVALAASGLLPPRPGGWATMSGPSGESTPETLDMSVEVVKAEGGDEPAAASDDEWDWKRIDAENKRGLKYAENFTTLEGIHSEFTGSQKPALGKYRDFLW